MGSLRVSTVVSLVVALTLHTLVIPVRAAGNETQCVNPSMRRRRNPSRFLMISRTTRLTGISGWFRNREQPVKPRELTARLIVGSELKRFLNDCGTLLFFARRLTSSRICIIIHTTKGSSYGGQSHQYGAKQKHLALPLACAN